LQSHPEERSYPNTFLYWSHLSDASAMRWTSSTLCSLGHTSNCTTCFNWMPILWW
jgi:hypothetical protein